MPKKLLKKFRDKIIAKERTERYEKALDMIEAFYHEKRGEELTVWAFRDWVLQLKKEVKNEYH